MRKTLVTSLLAAAVVLAGCANLKVPAEQALGKVEQSFGAIQGEAAKYLPDQSGEVETTLAALRDSFQKGEYQKVIQQGASLVGRIDELKTTLESKKGEFAGLWGEISSGLPGAVETLKGRLDSLSGTKKLPDGLTQEAVAGAKTQLESVEAMWGEATAAFDAGNLFDAVTKGQGAQKAASEIMAALGMQPSEAGQP